MKLFKLALTSLALFSILDSVAQEVTPGSVRDQRLLPAQISLSPEHRLGTAPWMDVRAEKRQYYVYGSFAPPELRAQLERPIANPAAKALLAARSAAFTSGARRMRLTIDPDAIVDVGTQRPEDANTVALVDLAKSPDLQAALTQELKVDLVNNYVMATLGSAFAKESGVRPAYGVHDALMVTIAAKDHSRVTVLKLQDGRWQNVSDMTAATTPPRDPQSLVNSYRMRGERLYYQGIDRIAVASNQTAFRNVAATQWKEIAARQGIANPLQAPTGLPAPLKSGSSTAPATSAPASTTKPAAPSTPTPTPPPPSYLSYGSTPWCSGHCSAGSCIGCCAGAMAAEQGTLFASSFACHLASDLCPWCHAGCAVMTAAMSSHLAILDTACITSCVAGRRVPASQGNPKHCPVQ
jgi:hypothetical protein